MLIDELATTKSLTLQVYKKKMNFDLSIYPLEACWMIVIESPFWMPCEAKLKTGFTCLLVRSIKNFQSCILKLYCLTTLKRTLFIFISSFILNTLTWPVLGPSNRRLMNFLGVDLCIFVSLFVSRIQCNKNKHLNWKLKKIQNSYS